MDVDFASVARLLANPARSAMVGALMGGRSLTAGELAAVAAVHASTASEHLAELVAGGLATVVPAGRHRYYSLSGAETAEALEALAQICPRRQQASLRASTQARAMSFARTCYDHLAGVLGVAILGGMLSKPWLAAGNDSYLVTKAGEAGLAQLGVNVAVAQAARRRFARPCLDWTERRPHLAGALGASIATALLDRAWVERTPSRAVRLTPAGTAGLSELLDLQLAPNGSAEPLLSSRHQQRDDEPTRTAGTPRRPPPAQCPPPHADQTAAMLPRCG